MNSWIHDVSFDLAWIGQKRQKKTLKTPLVAKLIYYQCMHYGLSVRNIFAGFTTTLTPLVITTSLAYLVFSFHDENIAIAE